MFISSYKIISSYYLFASSATYIYPQPAQSPPLSHSKTELQIEKSLALNLLTLTNYPFVYYILAFPYSIT